MRLIAGSNGMLSNKDPPTGTGIFSGSERLRFPLNFEASASGSASASSESDSGVQWQQRISRP